MFKITSDPSRDGKWHFRIGKVNKKRFVFKNANGTARDMSGEAVKFRFKVSKDDEESDAVLTLATGSGLTWDSNAVDVNITEAQSKLFSEAEYFFELELTRTSDSYKRNYLSAIASWHNGRFDAADSNNGEIKVYDDDGEVVVIQVSDSGSSTPSLDVVLGEGNDGNGEQIKNIADPTDDQDAATKKYVDDNTGESTVNVDGTTIEGDGSVGTPLKVKAGVFDAAGAAAAAQAASQPLNTNLTSIAALTTQSFGRSLLELANVSALNALLNSRTLWINNSSSGLTGSTSETKVASFLIPANTIGANDIIEIVIIATKSGTAGNMTPKVYFNTSDTVGGTQVAVNSSIGSNLWNSFTRRGTCKNATNAQVWYNLSNANNDMTSTNSAKLSTSIDFTVAQWIVISNQLGNGADTATIESVTLRIYRQ